MIPGQVYTDLLTVDGLSSRTDAGVVAPMDRAHVRRVRRYLSHQVRALIDLQLLTGARSGELVGLRAVDIVRGKELWTYCPIHHKTSRRGKRRVIQFGPHSQRILSMFITVDRPLDAPLFSPREAHATLRAREAEGRRRENQKPTPRRTGRVMGEAYTPASYGRAITRACERAGVPSWHPHQLRHFVGTKVRERYGLDVAQAVLGHTHARVTEIYAEVSMMKAAQVARQIG